MNLVLLQRSARRFFESGVSTRRVQKRIAFGGGLALLILVYVFLLPSSHKSFSSSGKCVSDKYAKASLSELHSGFADFATSFVGNGFVGVETALDKQIVVAPYPNATSIKAPIYTAFRPLVDVALPFEINERPDYVLDFNKGISRAVQCASFSDKCFCVDQFVYAHRTRPNLIIQEISISNPTTSFLSIKFNRRGNADWDQTLSGSSPAVFLKTFGNIDKVVVAVVCSSVPMASISIKAQTEEKFRFLCIVDESAINRNEGETAIRRKLVAKVAEQFTQINALPSNTIDREHFQAWEKLNSAVFNIDHSKAPNALNSHKINVTRHALLSVLRVPLLEIGTDSQKMAAALQSLSKTELCYSGHSTLLTPSKLWQDWSNVQELLRTVEIWLLTLEHNGCVHLLNAGASGAAQAFLLSLLAATFTHHRLEIALDPEEDLHRQLNVQNLHVGNAYLTIFFNLDAAYKPYAEVKIIGDSGSLRRMSGLITGLYACSAGCLEAPILLGENSQRLTLKVTKPSTPILYIAEDRQHLTQLKDTLHVSEVVDAPAPETDKVELHKHGGNTGLPTAFWAVLIFTLIAFHLFLLRLLYSEWHNSNSIPYARFSRRFLMRR